MPKIATLSALEILDSRGQPTLSVTVRLDTGQTATAAVPSGASTGALEAVELRDGDPSRYGGKGALHAVANVELEIAPALSGRDPLDQAGIDGALIALDGTPNKARLGANAILGVSMAIARAAADVSGVPLYLYLGGDRATLLPVPFFNVLNGGKHADNGIDFQEYMIAPVGAPSFAEALRYVAETYAALKQLVHEAGYPTGLGDEGGFAPNLRSNEVPCEFILGAIEKAGYRPGEDIALALDPAASSFGSDGAYQLTGLGGGAYNREDLFALYQDLIDRFPIISIEDGWATGSRSSATTSSSPIPISSSAGSRRKRRTRR
jgi:enolase